jgi:hypothetical protein
MDEATFSGNEAASRGWKRPRFGIGFGMAAGAAMLDLTCDHWLIRID